MSPCHQFFGKRRTRISMQFKDLVKSVVLQTVMLSWTRYKIKEIIGIGCDLLTIMLPNVIGYRLFNPETTQNMISRKVIFLYKSHRDWAYEKDLLAAEVIDTIDEKNILDAPNLIPLMMDLITKPTLMMIMMIYARMTCFFRSQEWNLCIWWWRFRQWYITRICYSNIAT